MTPDAQQPQREHCEHEAVCEDFEDYNSSYDYPPCGIRICADDIRTRPHTQAPERKVCCASCPCSTPDCEEDCPEWVENNALLEARFNDIARTATLKTLDKLVLAIADMGFPIENKTNEFDDGRACAYGYFTREIDKIRRGL